MKKTIKILLNKMENLKESKEGTLQGGFASIKGGFQAVEFSYNSAGGTGCSNVGDCVWSTNTAPGCSNTGTCFI